MNLLTLTLLALAHHATALSSSSSQTTSTPSRAHLFTTSITRTTTPQPTWTYTPLGCYPQSPDQPLLPYRLSTGPDIFMSIGLCTTSCALENFPLTGLHNGNECWCGSDLGDAVPAKNQSECNVPCPGYAGEVCGGVEAVSVFRAEGMGEDTWGVVGETSSTTTAPTGTSTLGGSGTGTGTRGVLTTVSTAGAMRNLNIFGW